MPVSFHTPVYNYLNSGYMTAAFNAAENYFHCGRQYSLVTSMDAERGVSTIINRSEPPHWLVVCLKVASYFLLVPVLFFGAIKIFNRFQHHYSLEVRHQEQVEELESLARGVIQSVRSMVFYSSNNLQGKYECLSDPDPFREGFLPIYNRHANLLEGLRDKIIASRLATSIFTFHSHQAHQAQKFNVGNCGEMTSIGLFQLIREQYCHLKVDYYSIEGGDHAFLVLGRDPASDPADYRTWQTAVVCDCWADAVYPALEIGQRLYGTAWMNNGYHGRADLVKFDSNKHRLSLVVSNFLAPEEMAKQVKSPAVADAYLPELTRFHEAKDLEEKLKIAESISELPSYRDRTVLLLKDQMLYFLKICGRLPTADTLLEDDSEEETSSDGSDTLQRHEAIESSDEEEMIRLVDELTRSGLSFRLYDEELVKSANEDIQQSGTENHSKSHDI